MLEERKAVLVTIFHHVAIRESDGCVCQLSTRAKRLGQLSAASAVRSPLHGTAATNPRLELITNQTRVQSRRVRATARRLRCGSRRSPAIDQQSQAARPSYPATQPGCGYRSPAQTAGHARTEPQLRGVHPAQRHAARPRRVVEDQLGIPCTLSMKGQPGVVIAAGGEQRLNDRGVNGCPSVRRNSPQSPLALSHGGIEDHLRP